MRTTIEESKKSKGNILGLFVLQMGGIISADEILRELWPGWEIGIWNALGGAIVLTILWSVDEWTEKKNRRIYRLILFGIGSYISWSRRVEISQEILGFCGKYGQKLSDYLKLEMHIFQNGSNVQEGKWVLIVFAVGIAVLGRLLGQYRVCVLLPGIFLIASLLTGMAPKETTLCMIFSQCIFASMLTKSAQGQLVREEHSKEKKQGVKNRQLFLAFGVLCGILAVSRTVFRSQADSLMERHDSYREFQKVLEKQIEDLFKGNAKADKIIVGNIAPRYHDRLMLRITSSQKVKSNLYLCGSVKNDYADGVWRYREADLQQRVDKSQEEMPEFRKWLAQRPYQAEKELGLAWPETEYQIDYENQIDRYTYIPYFAVIDDGKMNGYEQDAVTTKEVSQKHTKAKGSIMPADLGEYFGGLEAFEAFGEQTQKARMYNAYVNAYATKLDPSTEYIREYEFDDGIGEELNDLRMLYSAYEGAEQNGLRLEIARQIAAEFQRHYQYSMELDPLPSDQDAVEYFLNTSRQGFCKHFATAGALLLRRYHVPARAAFGYVVKRNAFREQKDGSYQADVIDRNAHAWVEIYLDDIGWVPFEMTPGYERPQAHLLTEDPEPPEERHEKVEKSPQENSVQEEPKGPEKEEKEEQEQAGEERKEEKKKNEVEEGAKKESTAKKKTSDQIKKISKEILTALVITLGVAVFFAGAVYLGKSEYDHYQEVVEEWIRKACYREAVLLMNRRMYRRVHRHQKIRKRSLTDQDYQKALAQMYPQIAEDLWQDYMEIVQRAAFSEQEITKEEVLFCHQMYKGKI